MRKGFSNFNLELFRSMGALRPSSSQFPNIELLTLFLTQYNIEMEEIKNESMIARIYLAKYP